MQIVPAPGLALEIKSHAEIFSVRVVGTSRWASCLQRDLAATISLLCAGASAALSHRSAGRWARLVLGELTPDQAD